MSKFSKTFITEIEFDGDKVTVEMQRMKNKHMILMSPYLSSDGEAVAFKNRLELIGVASQILPEVVIRFEGLVGSDGKPMKLEDCFGEMYFNRLVDGLIGSLIKNSTAETVDEKKSDKPSLDSPAGLPSASESKPAV